EHPLVDQVTSSAQRGAVDGYRARVAAMDLVTRRKTEKEKTGVFTGAHARNPATGADVPVWVADYLLMEYGTGAIMGVPGHAEREFEVGRGYGLPIVRVIAGPGEGAATPLASASTGPGVMVNSGRFDGMDWSDGKGAVTRWLADRGAAAARVTYRLHD